MLFRSPRSLARRTMAAGAASALALTLFNAAQPSLGGRPKIHEGTVKDVPITLTPTPTPAPAVDNRAHAPSTSAPGSAAAPPVDNGGRATSGSATLPHRGTEPGPGALEAARTPTGTQSGTAGALQSGAVPVGKARFVGFSWPDPAVGSGDPEAAGTVRMRARTAAGWSAWREVEPAADGPDATSPEYRPGRVYTDGQWLPAGTAEVQVRVDPPAAATRPAPAGRTGEPAAGSTPEAGRSTTAAGAARAGAPGAAGAGAGTGPAAGLRAHLITPDLTPTPGTEPARAGVATAATAQPGIVSRKSWGANESIRRAAPSYSRTVKAAIVHHTVQSNSYSPSESAALVRADYLYHVRSRGWNDVGYNFLVDRFGRVFEGRYGGITRAVLGAHSGGFNTETTGVAMLGTFSSGAPPAPMLAALQRLLAWKLDLSHVDPRGRTVLTSRGGANVRYPAGRRITVNTIFGHRTTSFTTCPGSPTLARLASIRAAVSRIGRPKIYGGGTSPSQVVPQRGVATGVSARFSNPVRWQVRVTASSGATVRSYAGTGTRASLRWNGRSAAGHMAPPGWATVTVMATAGGASARPAASRVFVTRTAPPSATSTGGFHRGRWSVSNVNAEQLTTNSPAFTSIRWGAAGDIPIVGDWDGDGTQTVGIVRPNPRVGSNHFALYNSNGTRLDFWYGTDGDRPVVGDWDDNGTWTPGVVRGGVWKLRNTNSPGTPDITATFGQGGDHYLTGDWNGDGRFGIGVFRRGTFYLRQTPSSGPPDHTVRFGRPGDLGFAGDWDADNIWTPGILRAGTRWYLKNSFAGTTAAVGLKKQTPGTPVVGNWDNRP